MTFKLSQRSLSRLDLVHHDLVAVVQKAIGISEVDFAVLEGRRTLERQKELFAQGLSKTMNSRHLTGHAVDLGAWVNGTISWDKKYYAMINEAMQEAAGKLDIPIRWGGDWDMDGDSKDEKFYDGPHFELQRKFYP